MSKNYARSEIVVKEVHYIEERVPTSIFHMEGSVLMNLWGGGQGPYDVSEEEWKQEGGTLTKQDIWDNMTDDGFGCESFVSCTVSVYQHMVTRRYIVQEDGSRGDPVFGRSEKMVFDGYISVKNGTEKQKETE